MRESRRDRDVTEDDKDGFILSKFLQLLLISSCFTRFEKMSAYIAAFISHVCPYS